MRIHHLSVLAVALAVALPLHAQGLPPVAESETEFFFKAVDAQISFGGDGMVLHQNGQNLPGKKIR